MGNRTVAVYIIFIKPRFSDAKRTDDLIRIFKRLKGFLPSDSFLAAKSGDLRIKTRDDGFEPSSLLIYENAVKSVRELRLVQFRVKAVFREQFGVRPLFDDLSVTHDKDQVGFLYR